MGQSQSTLENDSVVHNSDIVAKQYDQDTMIAADTLLDTKSNTLLDTKSDTLIDTKSDTLLDTNNSVENIDNSQTKKQKNKKRWRRKNNIAQSDPMVKIINKESKIKRNKIVRRYGYFKCPDCNHSWGSGYAMCVENKKKKGIFYGVVKQDCICG